VRIADSHFHSTAMAERGLDPGGIITELRAAGAGPMLDVAINPEDAPRQRELTGGIDGVYYSLGLHPGSTGRDDWREALELIRSGIAAGGYHAVGETGLDWYRMYAPRERQRELFAAHLELADHHALPVIVHNRDADEDCLELIRAIHPRAGGVMHCFSSGPEWVAPFLDAGMYISFAGNLTFKNAANLREAVALVPEDRLLLETDAPFLAPHPYRGRPNHPGLLVHTLEVAAEMRGIAPDDLAEQTAENLSRLLRLRPTVQTETRRAG
jgi:TatD DNase family protein